MNGARSFLFFDEDLLLIGATPYVIVPAGGTGVLCLSEHFGGSLTLEVIGAADVTVTALHGASIELVVVDGEAFNCD